MKLSVDASVQLEVMMMAVDALATLLEHGEVDEAKEGLRLLRGSMAEFLGAYAQLPTMPPLPPEWQ